MATSTIPKPLTRVHGAKAVTFESAGTKYVPVNFGKTFAETPQLMVSAQSGTDSLDDVKCVVKYTSTTGGAFVAYSNGARTVNFLWSAIG